MEIITKQQATQIEREQIAKASWYLRSANERQINETINSIRRDIQQKYIIKD